MPKKRGAFYGSLVTIVFILIGVGFIWVSFAQAEITCVVGNTDMTDVRGELVPSTQNTGKRLVQTFIVNADTTVITVKLYLSKVGNPGNATIGLYRAILDTNDYIVKPLSVPPEASATISASSVGTSGAWHTIRLDKPVNLVAWTPNVNYYALVLSVPSGSTTNYYNWSKSFTPSSAAGPYSGGTILFFGTNGWMLHLWEQTDLLFEVCNDTEAYKTVTPTTGGTATFVPDQGALATLEPIPTPTDKPPYVKFPYGFFDFSVTGVTPGANVIVTMVFDQPIKQGTKWWKKLANDTWTSMPIGSDDGDNVITITIQDQSSFDLNPTPGTVADPGGLGEDEAPPPQPIPVEGMAIPTSNPYGLIILVLLLIGSSLWALKRRTRTG